MQQDAEWMAQHYDELLEKYPGQAIRKADHFGRAIHEGEVVAVD